MKNIVAITMSLMMAFMYSSALTVQVEPVFAIEEDELAYEEGFETYEYEDEEEELDDEYIDEEIPDVEEETDNAIVLPVQMIPAQNGTFDPEEHTVTQYSHSSFVVDGIVFDANNGTVVVGDGVYSIIPPVYEELNGDILTLFYWTAKVDGQEVHFSPGDEVLKSELEGVDYMYALWYRDENGNRNNKEVTKSAGGDSIDVDTDSATNGTDNDEVINEEDTENTDTTEEPEDTADDELEEPEDADENESSKDATDEEADDDKIAVAPSTDRTISNAEPTYEVDEALKEKSEQGYGHCDFRYLPFVDASQTDNRTYVLPERSELRAAADIYYDELAEAAGYDHKPNTGEAPPIKLYIMATAFFLALVGMITLIRIKRPLM